MTNDRREVAVVVEEGSVRAHDLDASAMVKLIANDPEEEPGRAALRAFFFSNGLHRTTSYCLAARGESRSDRQSGTPSSRRSAVRRGYVPTLAGEQRLASRRDRGSAAGAERRPDRPCRPLGVPTPTSSRSSRPRLKRTRVNQQPLQDVRVTAQVRASHAAGLVQMREGPLDSLARWRCSR